jgi:hypothetical protein
MIISVDFDGTLALGNKSHITLSEPNYILINRLHHLKKTSNTYIKIVTARGAKGKLSTTEKEKKYLHLIKEFCDIYNVPYDEISFNKEYADLYIDDMTINEYDNFYGQISDFTKNQIIFTDTRVIKKCKTSLLEKEWYIIAKNIVNVPEILFCNDNTIITSRIQNSNQLDITDIIDIINLFKRNNIHNYPFETYINNLLPINYCSSKTKQIIQNLPEHDGTFFHGDLSISNILKNNKGVYLIDPNYKYIFGSYLTDAGKAFFSYIAYNNDFHSAKKILDVFGNNVIKFAVAEGLRVCKYKPFYISIVNNIADIL